MKSRIVELTRSNLQLSQEIEERKRAEGSLQGAYSEIKRLKDRLQAENCYLQQEIAQGHNFGEIIGNSGTMVQVRLRVEQVAALGAAVLLQGEAGTGKAVTAQAIHNLSERRDRPMITVHLAALPANLVEGELFGWERGECTGAAARQIGRFELADSGTIFLKDISSLPLESQAKLLRLIKDGELERLGSPRAVKVDARIIASSSRDLELEVREGRFREDLYCRLKVFSLTIPPLRERREDIPLLIDHFLAKYSRDMATKPPPVSSGILNALKTYRWPGNVRELESVVVRAVITCRGGELQLLNFRNKGSKGKVAPGRAGSRPSVSGRK